MNMWIIFGILILIGFTYVGIVNVPTTGAFVDIPNSAIPFLEQIGEPYIIVFWLMILFSSIFVIRLIGDRNG